MNATPCGALDAGLVIRVWVEPAAPDVVRARLLTFHGTEEPSSWTTAASEDDVLRAVDQWVRAQLRAGQQHADAVQEG